MTKSSTGLQTTGSTSLARSADQLLTAPLPDLNDDAAWAVPATRESCQSALAVVGTLHRLEISPLAQITITALAHELTQPELMYALRMLMQDPEFTKAARIAKTTGQPLDVLPSDLAQHVRHLRGARASVAHRMTEEEMRRVVRKYADLVDPQAFRVVGATASDEPLVKYLPTTEDSPARENLLAEPPREPLDPSTEAFAQQFQTTKTQRPRGGTTALGDLL